MGATEAGAYELARREGVLLEPGRSLHWLSNRGHLNPVAQESVPDDVIDLLRAIYLDLGGDESVLRQKRSGSSPRPDFVLSSARVIVEVDEIQHSTSDRARSIERYMHRAGLTFDVAEYLDLIARWSSVANGYRAAKQAVDFPRPGGRRAQRAYFDSVRDLLAPSFGWTVVRVPAPECDAGLAAARLVDRVRDVAGLG